MDEKLLAGMKLAPRGATPERLYEVEKRVGVKLPDDLRAFLQKRDGGRGKVDARNRPLWLWSADEIEREADELEVTRASPGLQLFGSDRSADAYGYLPLLKSGRYGHISVMAPAADQFASLG